MSKPLGQSVSICPPLDSNGPLNTGSHSIYRSSAICIYWRAEYGA